MAAIAGTSRSHSARICFLHAALGSHARGGRRSSRGRARTLSHVLEELPCGAERRAAPVRITQLTRVEVRTRVTLRRGGRRGRHGSRSRVALVGAVQGQHHGPPARTSRRCAHGAGLRLGSGHARSGIAILRVMLDASRPVPLPCNRHGRHRLHPGHERDRRHHRRSTRPSNALSQAARRRTRRSFTKVNTRTPPSAAPWSSVPSHGHRRRRHPRVRQAAGGRQPERRHRHHGELPQDRRRGAARHAAGRRPGDGARRALSRRRCPPRASACPRSISASCRAPAARSACRASPVRSTRSTPSSRAATSPPPRPRARASSTPSSKATTC